MSALPPWRVLYRNNRRHNLNCCNSNYRTGLVPIKRRWRWQCQLRHRTLDRSHHVSRPGYCACSRIIQVSSTLCSWSITSWSSTCSLDPAVRTCWRSQGIYIVFGHNDSVFRNSRKHEVPHRNLGIIVIWFPGWLSPKSILPVVKAKWCDSEESSVRASCPVPSWRHIISKGYGFSSGFVAIAIASSISIRLATRQLHGAKLLIVCKFFNTPWTGQSKSRHWPAALDHVCWEDTHVTSLRWLAMGVHQDTRK